MAALITVGVAFLGMLSIVIYSTIITVSVGLEIRGFVSAETKGKLIINNVLTYLGGILLVVFCYSNYATTSEGFEKDVWLALLITTIIGTSMIWIYICFFHAKNKCEIYYIVSNKLYKLKYIENDILFLVSMTSEKDIILKDRTFLFENNHLILNNAEYHAKKKERPDLF